MFIIWETLIHLTKTSDVWELNNHTWFFLLILKGCLQITRLMLNIKDTCIAHIFIDQFLIRQWCFVRKVLVCYMLYSFCLWIAQWIVREMTNTISLVSKEFCLQWIGIDVSLSRCVRLLCDIYFNEFGFIFILISDLFFCKPCSYYKVCITRPVNDYHVPCLLWSD